MTTDIRHAVRLARLDLKLLGRNQTALVNVVILPVLLAWMFAGLTPTGAAVAGVPAGLFVLTGMPGLMLTFAVFVNLVNGFTARREELVLKRLWGGMASPAGVLGGMALSAFVVYLLQVALLVLWITGVEDGPAPANIPLALLASLLGAAVVALLAAALSGITRTAELAQVTVLPGLVVMLLGAPLFVPVAWLPEPLRLPAELVPTTPVVEIMRTAFLGADHIGGLGERLTVGEQWVAALPSFGILLGWLVVAALLAHRLFRWDRRRG
jgi:ABC-type multidrug transport system, permease component